MSMQQEYVQEQQSQNDSYSNDNISQQNDHRTGKHRAASDSDSRDQRSGVRKQTDTQNDDRSSSDNSNNSSNISDIVELSQVEKLQNQILEIATELEKSTPYQNQLTMDLLQKLKDFTYASRSKSGQDLITIRIQQLVINKLLVLTYNRSQFRLILSHFHLGQAYLKYDCTDQAIEHLSDALHKIQKLFQTIPQTRLLQTFIQNQLAASLMKKQNFQDAIQLLNNSISQQNRLKSQSKMQIEDNNQRNMTALTLLSQCYSKINEYQTALTVIQQVIVITKKKKMAKQQYAFALVQKSKILALQENYPQSIKHHQTAIGTCQLRLDILMQQNYSKPQLVAQLYTTLSTYHQHLGNIQNALTCIQKVKTLYQQLYSPDDKRVIKARRKISTYLLRSQRFKEAVNQLLEVLELEEKAFGDNSLQTARTLKLLGAVYVTMEVGDARAYLRRAMNIFASHGNKKQVLEIKQKLKILMTGEGANIDTKILSEHEI